MKTITCTQLGGYCSQKLSAYTWDAMALVIAKHFTEKHAKKLAKHLPRANTKVPMEWVAEMKPSGMLRRNSPREVTHRKKIRSILQLKRPG